MKNLSQFLHAAARSSPLQPEAWINPDHIATITVVEAQPLKLQVWLIGIERSYYIVGDEAEKLLAQLPGRECVEL